MRPLIGQNRDEPAVGDPRLHEWAYLELADLDAADYNSALTGEWTRGLLIRRNIADGALAFFSTWCPRGTPREKLVSVEGHRWAIEDSFETAKNELGLDHNETRSWHGCHRHVSLRATPSGPLAVPRGSRHSARRITSTSAPCCRAIEQTSPAASLVVTDFKV